MKGILLVPTVILAIVLFPAATGFPAWLLQLSTASLPAGDIHVFDHGLGWWSPEMVEHWLRLGREPGQHAYANIYTEWTRLDAERSSKVWIFAIELLLLAHIARSIPKEALQRFRAQLRRVVTKPLA